jgi:hypothetical protein
MNIDLQKGIKYTKHEIEEIFNTKFGYGIKGITLRRWHDDTPYTIIFSRSRGPYSDIFNGSYLYYDGEGLKQDQKLTVANKALIESNKCNRIIFGFKQEEPNGKWKYIGMLKLVDYEYKLKDGFKKYEFKFKLEE